MYCPVGDHKAMGMTGKVVVASGGSKSDDPRWVESSEADDSETGDSGGGAGYYQLERLRAGRRAAYV